MEMNNTFESLLLNKRKGLMGHAFKLTGNSDDAEDLFQEVTLKELKLGLNIKPLAYFVLKRRC